MYLFVRRSYLNNWDKKIPNLDVADDYRSEREEIQKVQGKEFPFSFGDVSEHFTTHSSSLNYSLVCGQSIDGRGRWLV